MQSFQDNLENLLQSEQSIIIFKGSTNAQGENWCSDCVMAEPFIQHIIKPQAENLNIPLLVVDVGNRDEWKNPDHVLRKHPMFRLSGVPTICYIQNKKVIKRLQEDECYNQEIVNTLFE